MRSLIGTRFPTMRHRLYQGDPLEDDNVAQLPIDDAWTVEQAEARLQHAYDEGGWQGWASQAVVELNRELEWKRTRRA